jgi:tetratricopeptide (TPR) repeat protein
MRVFLFIAWLMLPVVVLAYHLGPGQDRLRLDRAAALLAEADRHVSNQEFDQAIDCYNEAVQLLPPDRKAEIRRALLERAKAQMQAHQLPEAHKDLQGLVEEVQADADADPRLVSDATAALASSRYYMTWLMRLEGLPLEEWEPEIEAARQSYRQLAGQAASGGDQAAAQNFREDVEATIRLARMDLSELQGLPLPSQ